MKKIIKMLLILTLIFNSTIIPMEKDDNLENDLPKLVITLQEILNYLGPTQPPQIPPQPITMKDQIKEELKKEFPTTSFEQPTLITAFENLIPKVGIAEEERKKDVPVLIDIIKTFNDDLKKNINNPTKIKEVVDDFNKNIEINFPATASYSRTDFIEQVVNTLNPTQAQAVRTALKTPPTPAQEEEKEEPTTSKQPAQTLPAWATIKVEELPPTAIRALANIPFEITELEKMRTTNPQEKAAQKEKARAILLGIDQLIGKVTLTDLQKDTLKTQINRILTIDPLLMPITIALLRKVGINDQELYDLMVKKYTELIDFIEKEFNQLKPGKKLSAGVSFDIYEGLTYPITISSETQDAQIDANLNCTSPDATIANKAQQAKQFVQEIDNLHQRLLKLIGNKKAQFETIGINLAEYENMLQGTILRSYCRVKDAITYVPVVSDIVNITNDIGTYISNKDVYSRLQRESMLRSILNRINGLYQHFTHKSFCKFCFRNDLRDNKSKYYTTGMINVDEKLTIIKDFLSSLPNASTDPTLIKLNNGMQQLSQQITATLQSLTY